MVETMSDNSSPYDEVVPSGVAEPVTASPVLGTSPAYLAFLRALGLDQATDSIEAQSAIDALNRRAGLARADIAAQGTRQRQNISDDAEVRGVWRSGARLRRQADQRADEGRQTSAVEYGAGEDIGELTQRLAERRLQRTREQSERALDTTYDSIAGGG